MGEIRNARCLLLQRQWNQYGDPRVDPIGRSLTGSITPIMTWILYADHQVDPMGRSLTTRGGTTVHAPRLASTASAAAIFRILDMAFFSLWFMGK